MRISTNGCSTQVKEKFAALSRLTQIVWIVFGIHLVLVFILCVHHFFWKEKPKTRIVVRTVQNIQPVIAGKKATTPKPIASAPKKSVSKTKVVVPKKGDPAPVKQKDAVAPKTKAAELPLPKEIPMATKAAELPLPKEIPIVEQEDPQPSYGQTLVAYLQDCLDLPEYGEVKGDLEIDRMGHLVRFTILEEKSKKNGEFLKKRLPELVLPCFNDNSNETLVFTITFKNRSAPGATL